ncbi:hypothetical protein [Tepidiphilus baoligensis]|uniref:Uncharacterized protein n=1 Tax=Tepidiphilus baoligensis TaxID=2698687 RepID=A0ABX1QPG0_9PROT|nr:hypothetical protein [Tepidiphilus baoligensis]NMH17489.1 hypothetical protein [Tepidiphilus baoligensis]
MKHSFIRFLGLARICLAILLIVSVFILKEFDYDGGASMRRALISLMRGIPDAQAQPRHTSLMNKS